MITDLHLAMSSVSQKSQEPGAYVMQSTVDAKNALRKREVQGIYVMEAPMTALTSTGTAELNGAFNSETRAVCTQIEPGVYVVDAKMRTSTLFDELTKEFNDVTESSQREEKAQLDQEKCRNKCAKKQCTKLACG